MLAEVDENPTPAIKSKEISYEMRWN